MPTREKNGMLILSLSSSTTSILILPVLNKEERNSRTKGNIINFTKRKWKWPNVSKIKTKHVPKIPKTTNWKGIGKNEKTTKGKNA